MIIPPKPVSRPDRVSLFRYGRLFRKDILSAQPERLYRAWMAEFKTPFFRSFLVNQPSLINEVLKTRPTAFPKSSRIAEGLRPLLGARSVFLTNGDQWQQQRRIIDPAFEGGRLRDTWPAMWAAGHSMLKRLGEGGELEIEERTSHAAADVIFRTLFSIPIEDRTAQMAFERFRSYQRLQPLLNLAAFVPGLPRVHRRGVRKAAKEIRALISGASLRGFVPTRRIASAWSIPAIVDPNV